MPPPGTVPAGKTCRARLRCSKWRSEGGAVFGGAPFPAAEPFPAAVRYQIGRHGRRRRAIAAILVASRGWCYRIGRCGRRRRAIAAVLIASECAAGSRHRAAEGCGRNLSRTSYAVGVNNQSTASRRAGGRPLRSAADGSTGDGLPAAGIRRAGAGTSRLSNLPPWHEVGCHGGGFGSGRARVLLKSAPWQGLACHGGGFGSRPAPLASLPRGGGAAGGRRAAAPLGGARRRAGRCSTCCTRAW